MAISHDPSLQPYPLAMMSNISLDSITNFHVGFSCGISTGVLLRRVETQVPSCQSCVQAQISPVVHTSLNTQVEFYSQVVLLVLTKCNKTNID